MQSPCFDGPPEVDNISGGRFLLIDDDAGALAAYSSSLRREGHEVCAFASFPEGLAALESGHFDMIVVKLREGSTAEGDRFWTLKTRTPAADLSSVWQAVSVGSVMWIWRTWEVCHT